MDTHVTEIKTPKPPPVDAAYLAAELGSEMVAEGDDLLLRIRPGMEGDARLVDLARVGDAVRLS